MQNQVLWNQINIADPSSIFIDVRTQEEFEEKNVKNFTLITINEAFLNNIEAFLEKNIAPTQNQQCNVYFMCRSGVRSERARQICQSLLPQIGNTKLNYYNIVGGILSNG